VFFVVCVILQRLATLIQYRRVTGTQLHDSIYRTSISLRGKTVQVDASFYSKANRKSYALYPIFNLLCYRPTRVRPLRYVMRFSPNVFWCAVVLIVWTYRLRAKSSASASVYPQCSLFLLQNSPSDTVLSNSCSREDKTGKMRWGHEVRCRLEPWGRPARRWMRLRQTWRRKRRTRKPTRTTDDCRSVGWLSTARRHDIAVGTRCQQTQPMSPSTTRLHTHIHTHRHTLTSCVNVIYGKNFPVYNQV